jgi:CRP-like cAMP-binding protein
MVCNRTFIEVPMPAETQTRSAIAYTAASPQTTNRILLSLPPEDYQRVAGQLKPITLRMKQVLMKQGEPIEQIVFPAGGVCSLVRVTEDGQTAEVAPVGNEGAIGVSAFFGQVDSAFDVLVQVPGPAGHALPVDAFRAEMTMRGALFNRIVRYNQALMTQIVQTATCNALHSAEQRCCRWLLMTHDRIGHDEFPLTHEFVATMLGVRRPTVTLVIAELQRAGLISHRRGMVIIQDRDRLVETACECYRSVRASFGRLLPEVSGAV